MTDMLEELTRGDVAVFQTTEQRRNELAHDLVAAAYQPGQVWLSDGVSSDYYLDKYQFMTKPTVLRRLASLLAERLAPDVDRLAAREPDAIVVAAALSLETGLPLVALKRDEPAQDDRLVARGELHAGERITVVEDVVSSGSHAAMASSTLMAYDVTVAGVLAVMDREEGCRELLEGEGVSLDALFTVSDLPLPARLGA